MKEFLTLAIDTSCDETSASVVRGLTLLSNVMPSQMEFHKKYGGVVPSLAKLAHQERIDNVVNLAMKKANITFENLDFIAVTYGPGLAIALEIGINKGKELAAKHSKPLIVINHMEGHLLSSFLLRNKSEATKSSGLKSEQNNIDLLGKVLFPALGVLVSGGHTELLLVDSFGKYTKIGETLDDSCGEAYDKCGRILGFGYPAGAIISKFAKQNRKNVIIKKVKENRGLLVKLTNSISNKSYQLPVSMFNSGDLNFSYSGLKTAFKSIVEDLVQKKLSHNDEVSGIADSLTKDEILDLCSLIEAAALNQLEIKVEKAIERFDPKEIWLGGGVIASAELRSKMRKICKTHGDIKLRYPFSNKLTGDNAAMIGVVANIKLLKSEIVKHSPEDCIFLGSFQEIDRQPNLSL